MKLALWNTERACLSKKTKLKRVKSILHSIEADLILLTETSSALTHQALPYYHSSQELPALDHETIAVGMPNPYCPGEVRASILSRYPIVKVHEVSNPMSSCCADIDTPNGIVRVLVTILGVIPSKYWQRDFEHLEKDLAALFIPEMIVTGDFNITMPTGWQAIKAGREQLNGFLSRYQFNPITRKEGSLIDHIAIGPGIGIDANTTVNRMNVERNVSDHPVVLVDVLMV